MFISEHCCTHDKYFSLDCQGTDSSKITFTPMVADIRKQILEASDCFTTYNIIYFIAYTWLLQKQTIDKNECTRIHMNSKVYIQFLIYNYIALFSLSQWRIHS